MIDHKVYAAYESALSKCSELAVGEFRKAVAKLGDGATNTEMSRLYIGVCHKYGAVSSKVATEFYEGVREGVETDYKPIQVQAPVALVEVGMTGFEDSAVNAIKSHVYSSAESTLKRNARRDPAKPKWALVPHPGCCSICISIGSIGFRYHSNESIDSQRHQGCTCTPIVDFSKNPALEGYDHKQLEDIYRGDKEEPQEWKDARNARRRERRAEIKAAQAAG